MDTKKEINKILECNIKFDKHFDTCFNELSINRQDSFIKWIQSCKDGDQPPITTKDREIIAFILKSNQSNFRAILTKKKNEYFLWLFLGVHKYYDKKRKELGI